VGKRVGSIDYRFDAPVSRQLTDLFHREDLSGEIGDVTEQNDDRLERIEHALMFMPRAAVRRRFHLSRSELEDIVGPAEAEPERNTVCGY